MGTWFRARSAVLVWCVLVGGLAACTSSSKPKVDLTTYPPATMGTTTSTASAPATAAQVSPATTARPKPSPSQSAQSPTGIKAHPSTPKTPTATPTAGTVPVPADVKRSGYNFHDAREQPPAMPATALQHSPAGARAFAEFFVKTIDWGYATTSGSYMRHYYSATCEQCPLIAGSFTNATAKKQHYVGGRFAILSTREVTEPPHFGSEHTFDIQIKVGAVYLVDSKNKITGLDTAYTSKLQVWAAWSHNRWTIVILNRLE